jgi:hypothetical protein
LFPRGCFEHSIIFPKKRDRSWVCCLFSLPAQRIDDDNEDQTVASPNAVSCLREIAEMMTTEQIGAVRAFLEYVQHRSQGAGTLRRFIGPTLQTVWKLQGNR